MPSKTSRAALLYGITGVIAYLLRLSPAEFNAATFHMPRQPGKADSAGLAAGAPDPSYRWTSLRGASLSLTPDLAEAGELAMSNAAAVASRAAMTEALNQFTLTPIQRISVRDYVGEGKVVPSRRWLELRVA